MIRNMRWAFIGMAMIRFWDWMRGVPEEWDPGKEFFGWWMAIAAVLLIEAAWQWYAQRSAKRVTPNPEVAE